MKYVILLKYNDTLAELPRYALIVQCLFKLVNRIHGLSSRETVYFHLG
jgi:hypothetical protein